MSLLLSGGGLKVAAFLGALEALPGSFEAVYGVSAGALLAALLAVGYAPREILALLQSEDWSRVAASSFSFARLAAGAAPASRAAMRRLVASWLGAKGVRRDATFASLEGRIAPLGCFAADLDGGELRLLDAASAPEVRLLDALMAAMAVPLLFEPVLLQGRRHVDAALANNSPASLCPVAPRLVLATHDAAPEGWGESLLLLPWLRCNLLARAEERSARPGVFLCMPRAPERVHLFRADAERLELLFRHGALAARAAPRLPELLGLLALALLRL